MPYKYFTTSLFTNFIDKKNISPFNYMLNGPVKNILFLTFEKSHSFLFKLFLSLKFQM